MSFFIQFRTIKVGKHQPLTLDGISEDKYTTKTVFWKALGSWNFIRFVSIHLEIEDDFSMKALRTLPTQKYYFDKIFVSFAYIVENNNHPVKLTDFVITIWRQSFFKVWKILLMDPLFKEIDIYAK